MFNDQIKEQLKKYLMLKAAPTLPGLAEGTMAMDAIRAGIKKLPSDWYDPQPQGPIPMTPEEQAAAEAQMPKPPAMPLVAPKPAIPAAAPVQQNPLRTVEPTPAPVQQTLPSMPQTDAVVQPTVGSEYNDAARQQLYAALAKKRTDNAAWAAAGSLGDMAARMGGGTPSNTQQTILAQGKEADVAARSEFEAGKKGQVEDISTNLALRKAGREETEYQDQNNANSQMSKLAVGMGAQLLGPQKTAQMGWQPGKTTYADVIKVLPIMEKQVALETARANKELALSEKTGQFNDNKTRQFREEIQGGKPYQALLTVSGMAKSVRMAAKNPSAYGDLSAIYAMVKGLDPTSVVREGEIGLMREVAGLKDRLTGTLEKWGGKGPLTGSQMADVERIMTRLEQIASDNVRAHAEPTLNQARRMGLMENEIMGNLPAGTAKQPAPAAGGDARRARIAQLRAELGR